MKKMIRRYSLLSLVLALVLSLSPMSALLAEPAPEATPDAGEEPINFFAQLKLTDIYGKPFDASVFNGKPAFINIWATWCGPCVSEMPHLDELAREYADKITIIGLHAEGMTVKDQELVPWEEKNEAARALAEKLSLTFPLLIPDNDLFVIMNIPDYGLQVSSLPTTWLIDGQGSIKSVIPGARDKETWQEIIDGFLKHLEENAIEKDEG
ncbi:MAG: TlpA family protein disulfide reductase [Christensenellales bacterium]|jgi:thiol-disulfide isomerase/thioredoxin